MYNRHSAGITEGWVDGVRGIQQPVHTFFIDGNLKLDLLAGFFNYAVIHGRTVRNRRREGTERCYDAV